MLLKKSRNLHLLAFVTITTCTVSDAQISAPVTNQITDAERVKLSVFEVTTSKDIGYQSTNAAEVTRMDETTNF